MLVHDYTAPNRPENEATGLYQRWYIRMDQATINAARWGQIKLLLNRSASGGQNSAASWLHMGVGGQFPAGQDNIGVLYDFNTGLLPNGQSDTGFEIIADEWIELQTWYLRSGGVGRARLWINGKNFIDVSSSSMGTDDTSELLKIDFAIAYTQQTASGNPLTLFIDDTTLANGYVDQVIVP